MGGGLWLGGHSAIGMLQVLHIWVFQYIGLRVLGGGDKARTHPEGPRFLP